MRTLLALTLALGTALPGCSQPPDLDDSVSTAARVQPYPDLIPLDGIRERLSTTRIAVETMPAVEARVAQLNRRAARLRGSVIDADTQARMKAGVQQ